MSNFSLKIFFASSIFITILFAGWYPFKKKRKADLHFDYPIGETLGTGVFLGAALLHMLPRANDLFNDLSYHFPLAFLITGIVFLSFLWLEHLGKELYQDKNQAQVVFALFAWVMLSIHSLLLGTALGLSENYSVVIMLFAAIIAHKWAESFAIAVQLNKSKLSKIICVILFLVFALMTPLGMMIGSYFGHEIGSHSVAEPILLALSAGTFLYLGTLHGLERCVMVKRCCNLSGFSFVIIGFVLMGLVALYI